MQKRRANQDHIQSARVFPGGLLPLLVHWWWMLRGRGLMECGWMRARSWPWERRRCCRGGRKWPRVQVCNHCSTGSATKACCEHNSLRAVPCSHNETCMMRSVKSSALQARCRNCATLMDNAWPLSVFCTGWFCNIRRPTGVRTRSPATLMKQKQQPCGQRYIVHSVNSNDI